MKKEPETENKTKAKSKKPKRRRVILIALSAIIASALILGVIFIDDTTIEYEYFQLDAGGLRGANGADGASVPRIKIAHLSDLHFPKIKVDTAKLFEKLSVEKPDIIAVTGDLVDNKNYKADEVSEFIKRLAPIAPVFYVNGNHETKIGEAALPLYEMLRIHGVTVLFNQSARITVNGLKITVTGLINDADYALQYFNGEFFAEPDYKILLAHRPEKWPAYSAAPEAIRPNLVLSGHVHGGQFRVFGQGVAAPGQGLFPKYDGGLYKTPDGGTSMIISRGIGASLFPFRFNNPPHVPMVEVRG
ncbi:MAG: metallophosphoesterase [Firmicutes bacterium]|nr:metallophosphoesterase [Bacillota bacterium]